MPEAFAGSPGVVVLFHVVPFFPLRLLFDARELVDIGVADSGVGIAEYVRGSREGVSSIVAMIVSVASNPASEDCVGDTRVLVLQSFA